MHNSKNPAKSDRQPKDHSQSVKTMQTSSPRSRQKKIDTVDSLFELEDSITQSLSLKNDDDLHKGDSWSSGLDEEGEEGSDGDQEHQPKKAPLYWMEEAEEDDEIEFAGNEGSDHESIDEEEDGEDEEEDEEEEDGEGLRYFENEEGSDFESDNSEENEFEKINVTMIKKNEESSAVPFWFGCEDVDQIKTIVDMYYSFLKLGEIAKSRIREPKPFVGRIKRCKVQSDNVFTTLDFVEVFRNPILPPDTELPSEMTEWIVTSWSAVDGVPQRLFKICNQDILTLWQSRLDLNLEASYLYCLPFGEPDKQEFRYSVLDQHSPVTSIPNRKRSTHSPSFNRFIPVQLRRPLGFDCDEKSLFKKKFSLKDSLDV